MDCGYTTQEQQTTFANPDEAGGVLQHRFKMTGNYMEFWFRAAGCRSNKLRMYFITYLRSNTCYRSQRV